jgi:hypothetical protein
MTKPPFRPRCCFAVCWHLRRQVIGHDLAEAHITLCSHLTGSDSLDSPNLPRKRVSLALTLVNRDVSDDLIKDPGGLSIFRASLD